MKQRILLKLSGEALSKANGIGIDLEKVKEVAYEVKGLKETGVSIGIVVGAGNMWRGRDAEIVGMDRINADQMGMVGTIFNAMALKGVFDSIGLKSRIMTAIPMGDFAETFNSKVANDALDDGEVIVFGGGTGKPFFSTDTTAALRALEINASMILMAKNGTDGVYDSDPRFNKDAKRYEKITYLEILQKHLNVMDLTAASLCLDSNIKTIVFDMGIPGNIKRVIENPSIGTIISK